MGNLQSSSTAALWLSWRIITIFLMFLKEVLSPKLHLFDQKYSKNSNTVKYCYSLK